MLTVLEVSNVERDRVRDRALPRVGGDGVRWVIVEPDRGTWTEARGRELIIEHLEASPRPGSSARALLQARPLRELVQLHRPAAIVCGSAVLLPALIHLASARLEPRPALIGRWRGDEAGPVRRELGRIDPRLIEVGVQAAGWWGRQGLASLDAVLVGTRSAARELWARGLDRIYYTPPGVDLDCFSPHRREPKLVPELGLARELGREGQRLIIALRCPPQTDAAELRRLHAALCRRLAGDPTLVIFGPAGERIERFVAGTRHVHLPAAAAADADERGRWLAACDLALVLPTLGGGPACAEAMACALPIVLADDELGEAELVREAGCGRALASLRPEALAEATLELVREARLDELGRRARTFIERFALDTCVARELACIREVVERVRAGKRVPTGIHERLPHELLAQLSSVLPP